MRYLVAILCGCFALSAFAFEPPVGSGVINARLAPYNAVGDGVADDTAALNAALNGPRVANSAGKIVYLPPGTYRITDTVAFPDARITLMGAGIGQTTIRLDANASLFQDPGNQRAAVSTRVATSFSANQFRVYVNDLAVDVGAGNPGAIGIKLHQNNSGGINNVRIRSLDPAGVGALGLDIRGTDKGPGLVRNLEVVGFEIGVASAGTEYSMTFMDLNLSAQRTVGLDNTWNLLQIEGLLSSNQVPVVRNNKATANEFRWGSVAILDGVFSGGSASVSAIENEAQLYLRNVTATGYQSLLRERGAVVPGATITERVIPRVESLFGERSGSLNLPRPRAQAPPEPAPASWISVATFGANGADEEDDAPEIQAAVDSGAQVIFFPTGRYILTDPILLRNNVARLVGFESVLEPHPVLVKGPLIALLPGNAAQVTVEQFDLRDENAINVDAPRDLLIKHSSLGRVFVRRGRLFIEDVVGGPYETFVGSSTYLRQANPENSSTKIINRGTLFALGLKTEKAGTILRNLGGQAEIIGGLIYPVNALPLNQPMFINNDGELSVMVGESAFSPGTDHKLIVQERRAGTTRRLFDSELPGRVGFGLGTHLTLYSSGPESATPALAAHYRLDALSGAAVDDASPNLRHGTQLNASWITDGIRNGALRFNGQDALAELPTGFLSSAAGAVSLWMRTSSAPSDQAMLFYGTASADPNANGGGPENELTLNLDNQGRAQAFIEGGASDVVLSGAQNLADGEWHHLVLSWRQGGFVDLLVDGKRVDFAGPRAFNDFVLSERVRLAAPSAAGVRRFTGDLDEVRLFAEPLTHGQALKLYFDELGQTNYAPTVEAGRARVVQLASRTLPLMGEVNDDGQPTPAALSSLWSKLAGPGTVSFDFANAPLATATFSADGDYRLRLTATDTLSSASDEVDVKIVPQLTAPWAARSIGQSEVDGYALDLGGNRDFDVRGAGVIGGSPVSGGDRFQQVFRSISTSSNSEIVGCVDAVPNAAANSLHGLMFRGTGTTSTAANALLAVRGGNTLIYQNRAGAGGGTSLISEIAGIRLPLCLRLKRINTNQVQAAYSSDGLIWNGLPTATVNLGSTQATFSLASASGSDSSSSRGIYSRACVASFSTEPTACMLAVGDLLFRSGFEF